MAGIKTAPFGTTKAGERVTQFTLTNENGLRARVIDYGGILVTLEAPDREGRLGNVTLGCDTIENYEKNSPYFGAVIGRYANRIRGGKFSLDGVEYTLATNDGDHHLHGGDVGFDKVVWAAEPLEAADGMSVRFTYLSKDGEEGYPGNLQCTSTYTLTNANELMMEHRAKTDKATIVNISQHSYWNLAGQGEGDILGHELKIYADRFTPVDAGLIPTGELKQVLGTPMDFIKPHKIGERIAEVEGGYDHNYVLFERNFVLMKEGVTLKAAAIATEASSGRVMEVFTTEPGIQLYTGNFLDGSFAGRDGKTYPKHGGFCLETQKFPDSPNQPSFPSPTLRPGEEYVHTTLHRFSTQ